MKPLLPRSLAALLLLLPYGVVRAADKPMPFAEARRFMEQYCNDCHGPTKPKGSLNLKRFASEQQALAERKLWEEVAARVSDADMPPKSRKDQPTPEARKAFLVWAEQMHRAVNCDDTLRPGPAPVRRLNKSQYRATIRDLLGIHFDAASGLPDDGAGGEGFDNAAETLFLSPVHAEKYLEAARAALAYAARDSRARSLLFVATPDERMPPEEAARRVLDRFVLRAFRRPPRDGEVDRFLGLFRKEQARGRPFDESIFHTLQAVLISPHFLFRVEEPATTPGPQLVNDYELATRLSYFLWNSMPDDRLFEKAAAGKLRDPAVLKEELTRMLKDRKLRGLAESFTEQWLETRRLGREVKPDRQVFRNYTDELENAMREEPILVMLEVLSQNRSLLTLFDADFTYADRALALHYGLPPPEGFGQLNRVPLPKGSHRGGVLTMAGVLAISSYPHRTSPVLRGTWVMGTILGTPPPTPPPDVPELPDGAKAPAGKTLRERLVAHRANPACAACHERIDPIGFSLENFDAVGRWRDRDAGQPIDASAALPDGARFAGPEGLKQVVLARKDQVVRHLANKFLGYALGRGLVREDTCVIDRALERLTKDDYRAQTLLWEIVSSAPFRYKAGTGEKEAAP